MGDAAEIRTVVVPCNARDAAQGNALAIPVVELAREITTEIVAVIQAAANEFFGKRVRIVSIRILPGSNAENDVWLQRGRDTIQASHNLVQRRH
jgi:N-acetylglutamate synthase-like GNAT family acetyltransferase